MKYIAATTLLALVACEDIQHFTEGPDRGKEIVIPFCPTDTTQADTTTC